MTFSHFLGKFKNGPFWPKLTQIWPKFGHIWLYQARSTGVQKTFSSKIMRKNKLQNRKKHYFGRQKSTFCPYEHHYDSPLPTLRKILKFLKWRFFALFFEKNQKFYYFFISLIEIWLVQLKLKFLVSYHSEIGLILTKNRSFWASIGSKLGYIEPFFLIMS